MVQKYSQETAQKIAQVFKGLRVPIDPKYVQKTYANQTRKGYDTTGYPAAALMDRLNEVLFMGCLGYWEHEFEVLKVEEGKTAKGLPFSYVFGKATITVVIDEVSFQFSGYGQHASKDVGDAHKGAVTNSFKRAAMKFGLGIEAFLDDIDMDYKVEPDVQEAINKYPIGAPMGRPAPTPAPAPQAKAVRTRYMTTEEVTPELVSRAEKAREQQIVDYESMSDNFGGQTLFDAYLKELWSGKSHEQALKELEGISAGPGEGHRIIQRMMINYINNLPEKLPQLSVPLGSAVYVHTLRKAFVDGQPLSNAEILARVQTFLDKAFTIFD